MQILCAHLYGDICTCICTYICTYMYTYVCTSLQGGAEFLKAV